jgi:hypothetical protein
MFGANMEILVGIYSAGCIAFAATRTRVKKIICPLRKYAGLPKKILVEHEQPDFYETVVTRTLLYI